MLEITYSLRFVAELDLDHHYIDLFKPHDLPTWEVLASMAIKGIAGNPRLLGHRRSNGIRISHMETKVMPDPVFVNVSGIHVLELLLRASSTAE